MKNLIITAALAFTAMASSAQASGYSEVSCTRTYLDPAGFTTPSAAESWNPEYLDFKIYDDYALVGDSRSTYIQWKSEGKRVDMEWNFGGTRWQFKILPNGTGLATLGAKGGFQTAGTSRYKCQGRYVDTTPSAPVVTPNASGIEDIYLTIRQGDVISGGRVVDFTETKTAKANLERDGFHIAGRNLAILFDGTIYKFYTIDFIGKSRNQIKRLIVTAIGGEDGDIPDEVIDEILKTLEESGVLDRLDEIVDQLHAFILDVYGVDIPKHILEDYVEDVCGSGAQNC